MINNLSRWKTHRRYLFLLAKVILAGCVIALLVFLWNLLSGILLPLGISLLLAYLLDPFVDWFELKGVNRTVAIFILLLMALSSLTVFMVVIIPTVAKEVLIVSTDKVPLLIDSFQEMYIEYSADLKRHTGYTLPLTFTETFSNYSQKIEALAADFVQQLTMFTGNILTGTATVLVTLGRALLVPLFLFYFLRDFDQHMARLKNLLPLPIRERVLHKVRRVDSIVGHWFRGQLTVAAILGVLYTLVLGLCGVKLWFAIGVLAGVLSVVPYLGFISGLGLALLMSLLDNNTGWSQFVIVILMFSSVITFDAYMITPRVMGKKVGLSPWMVIVVLLSGAQIAGFFGVLLAIPLAGVCRVFILDAIADFKRSRMFLGEENYIRLLTTGPAAVTDDVRDALRQAAEVDLDLEIGARATDEEVHNMSVAMMLSGIPSEAPMLLQELQSARLVMKGNGSGSVDKKEDGDKKQSAS